MARISWAERIARGVARGLTPSQAAGKAKPGEAIASAISGRPLRGAARRGAEARAAALPGPPVPPVALAPPPARWETIPGGSGGLYTSSGSESGTRGALEAAAEAGRQVIVHIHADVVENESDPRHKDRATITQVPARTLLAWVDRSGLGTWGGLAEFAMRTSRQGIVSIRGVHTVEVKSYP